MSTSLPEKLTLLDSSHSYCPFTGFIPCYSLLIGIVRGRDYPVYGVKWDARMPHPVPIYGFATSPYPVISISPTTLPATPTCYPIPCHSFPHPWQYAYTIWYSNRWYLSTSDVPCAMPSLKKDHPCPPLCVYYCSLSHFKYRDYFTA